MLIVGGLIERLEKDADVWEPVSTTDGTSSITVSEPYCLQDVVTVEITKDDFDKILTALKAAEALAEATVDTIVASEDFGHGDFVYVEALRDALTTYREAMK